MATIYIFWMYPDAKSADMPDSRVLLPVSPSCGTICHLLCVLRASSWLCWACFGRI